MRNPEELITALEQAGEELARLLETQPEAAFQYRPAPEEWTAAEVAGHASEFPVRYSTVALRLAQTPGIPIGRGPAEDASRTAGIASLTQTTPLEAAAAVRESTRRAVETLRQIPLEGWQSVGTHPRLGDLTVAQVVERFVSDHCRNHVGQARAALAAADSD